MELLLVLAWFGFLAYIAKTRTGALQLHLVVVWALMFLSGLVALIKLIWKEMQ